MPKRTHRKGPSRGSPPGAPRSAGDGCSAEDVVLAAGELAAGELAAGELAAGEGQRRCVVCGAHAPRTSFLRFRLVAGTLAVDARPGIGRGASVCVRRDCLLALSPRSLGRVLRAPVASLDTDAMMVELHQRAQRRVLETIGLARRAGVLDCGVEKVAELTEPGTVAVMASDLAERSRRVLGHAIMFLPAEALGRAAGMGRVGAFAIRPGSMAERAAYWLGVWYETRVIGPEQRGGDGLMLREPSLQASASEQGRR